MECQSLAKAKIPEVLKTLEETRTQKNQYQFYGDLWAYFTSIDGHRPGLDKNMLVEEVEEAKCDQSGMYLISVEEHKTNRDHGMVQMSLTKDEYTWFSDFLKFKHCLPGGKKSQHFFFNSTSTQLKNLPAYLREVWKEMGLPETPTFTDLRTSIVTHEYQEMAPDSHMGVLGVHGRVGGGPPRGGKPHFTVHLEIGWFSLGEPGTGS
ncbi:uncharacterized protein LOC123485193 [Coregonus clupeaformis]|uniref:uncharacterized protein LOC123485193 n=1 Tax=Coregonus clupeaformis TaxID=59861 RepID=UPI001E1C4184|nr:uncharacterized protein LOC123485193 [Coregonus clupeaformis]